MVIVLIQQRPCRVGADLLPHVNAAHRQQRAQLWVAVLLQALYVSHDDLMCLPRQLPGRAHYQAHRALTCHTSNPISCGYKPMTPRVTGQRPFQLDK